MTLAMTSGLATAVNDKTRRHSNWPYGNKDELTREEVVWGVTEARHAVPCGVVHYRAVRCDDPGSSRGEGNEGMDPVAGVKVHDVFGQAVS